MLLKIKAAITKHLASDPSDLTIGQLIRVAWNSASTFRSTDFRGGANGARIRLEPQKGWTAFRPVETAKVISILEEIGKHHGASVADMIVIGGTVAVEQAAGNAGFQDLKIPLRTGRGDATQVATDKASFEVLKPEKDAFLNQPDSNPYMMVDKAHKMGLTAPEMVCLLGGLRVLGGNCKAAGNTGVLTDKPEHALTNDFFVNLCDMATVWEPVGTGFVGKDRVTGEAKWNASLVDLSLGSNPELRAICEYYAQSDSKEDFATDFANAWGKVMVADSYGRF